MSDNDDEFAGRPHARASDPPESHDAIPPKLLPQAITLLRSGYYRYRANPPMHDYTAYDRSLYLNLPQMKGKGHQRCSDLLREKLIEVVDRTPLPSGKNGRRCRITDKGVAFLKDINLA